VRIALWQAAGWVGCDDVRVEVVDPPDLAGALRRTVAAGPDSAAAE
jgi:uncharacterized protein